MPRYKLVFSKPVLKTPVFDVTHDRAEGPEGFAIERKIVQNSEAAVMLATEENGDILLIRQYRLPPRKELWELPAGRCDAGETPLRTARRELAEETGYRARRWRKLTAFYPAPGFASERMHAFWARGLTAGPDSPEPHERIRKRWYSPRDVFQMIARGTISDGKTILTLLYWERFRSRR